MLKYILVTIVILTSWALSAQTSITYQASTNDFANPERGFYRYSETRSSNYTFLDQNTLEGYRLLHTPPTANYSIYSTLVFRYFFLEDFKASNISQDYLDNMQADFNTARLAGIKLIPRFAYTDEVDGSSCSNWICPPYGDASKSWVLTHINQLKPVIEDNKDVIATVQMGLIGVWGENYYTDFFGDASLAPDFKLLDENWTDRIDVLNELLDAVPVERMVQVRYPQQKQRTIYGINAATDVDALTIDEAFSETDKARIGFHNDCLLASSDDFGTYTDYGNSSSSSMSDTTNLKPYLADDSKFVVVGGETCNDDYSPQNNCSSTDPSAFADSELERMHYSYLNSQYNNDVNNDWEAGGCLDDIKKRLGYRFELQYGLFSDAAQPGQVFEIDINLKNVGYASPYNERGVELMLRNTTTLEVWLAILTDDPRYWFADNSIHNISETICIPAEIPTGTYEVLLNLPDPMLSLHSIPAYSIRLANLLPDNSDPWESTTGYNKLDHLITIDNTASNSACNGEITLSKLLNPLPINLVDFKAMSQNENIVLKWATSSEYNNEGFHIEKSLNSQTFSKIAWKDGRGTSDELSQYNFIDTKVEPNTIYYYRLTQQDMDGTFHHSEIVTAKVTKYENDYNSSITLYPNPTKNNVMIESSDISLNLSSSHIKVINILGLDVSPPIINNQIIDLTHLPNGVYFIELDIKDDKILKKVIKH